MDALWWERMRSIFAAAQKLPPGERTALVEDACAGQETLRSEIDHLLEALPKCDGFLENPVLTPEPAPPDALLGTRIGNYRLTKRIGRGGMGVVYLGIRNDDEFSKRVAIKLLKSDDRSDEISRRFRDERQILAGLDHPNIARLLDGGTTPEGLPYLVMEYVEGQPLDEYCDSQGLSIRERLELFRTVCSAVHYAHQNLVVHRDLKPANILVTRQGVPKLLDFGIAKLLNPELSLARLDPTATALRVMTPGYASPEQIRGEPITTASDVYSLGVLLYRLLSSRSPYPVNPGSPADLVRAICEEEPAKPSDVVMLSSEIEDADGETVLLTPVEVSKTREGDPSKLRRRLAGDVDNIALMALRKEPHRRYSSAEQLAEDIRKHLAGLPILARKSTPLYRLSKFVGRNRWAVAATAALVLASLLFGTVMAVQSARIVLERDHAELVTQFLVELFEFSDPYAEPGSERGGDIPVRDVLQKGAVRLTAGLEGQAELESRLRGTVGTIFERLGLFRDARPLLESALASRRQQHGKDHEWVADSLYDLASLEIEEARYGEARRLLEEALAIRERTVGQNHLKYADTLGLLGVVYSSQGEHEKADAVLTQGLALKRKILPTDHAEISNSLNDLGLLRQHAGQFLEAEKLFRESLHIRERLFEPPHPELAESFNNLATLILKLGKFKEADSLYDKSLQMYRESLGDKHPYVIRSLNNLATVRYLTGHLDEAEPLYRDAIELHLELDHSNPCVARAMYNLANLLAASGRFEEAEDLLRRSLLLRREYYGPEHDNVAESLDLLGFVIYRQGDPQHGEALMLQSLEMRRRILGNENYSLTPSQLHLSIFYAEQGDPAKSVSLARDALKILGPILPADHWLVKRLESVLGDGLARMGQQEAEPLLRGSYEGLRDIQGDSAPWVRAAHERLNRFLAERGGA